MLATLAVILLVVWILGLSLHWLGSFIYIALVLAVVFGIAHFLTGRRSAI